LKKLEEAGPTSRIRACLTELKEAQKLLSSPKNIIDYNCQIPKALLGCNSQKHFIKDNSIKCKKQTKINDYFCLFVVFIFYISSHIYLFIHF